MGRFFTTKKAAMDHGRDLKLKMKSTGWNVQVHENPEGTNTWHLALVMELREGISLKLYVHPDSAKRNRVTYSCLLGDIGGETFWLDHKSYDDPNEAVLGQWKIAHEFIREKSAAVSALGDRLRVSGPGKIRPRGQKEPRA